MVSRTLYGTLVLVAVTCGLFGFACQEEPPVRCTIASGDLSARFYPLSGSGSGSGAGDGGCSLSPGDVFGVTAYVPNPTDPGDGLSKLAIQSQTLGLLRQNGESVDPPVVDSDPSHFGYALGKFDTVVPNSDGVCTVSQLAPAELALAAVSDPNAGIDQAATDLKYAWSNVRILVTAAQIGVQMTGDLVLTQDGCSAAYHVAGLWPSVSCAALDDAGTALTDDAGNPVLDPSACSPDNGINPNVDVACDPVQALCVPAREQPF
ncbi:MAG TPA: hypothetical protein VGI39_44750 [Polyangiaceae bacterium]